MSTLVDLIANKRDGGTHAPEEIRRLIQALGSGELADYQLTAWLMAVYFQGMTPEETAALTEAMLRSGEVIDLGDVDRPKVDKHSTGGVGDKVSICLAPLVAACGVAVPMISGRGLGHTGGTLDKLEAIEGFQVGLEIDRFRAIVDEVGVCMIGQTGKLAPADKRIYALRDVTATVEAIPLIVASILSKKLAEGIDALVLDVKVGQGAFMKTRERARELAQALVDVGTASGKKVHALLTDMEAPLGFAVGNAMETREAIDVLRGDGPDDVVECTLALGAEMLVVGGVEDDLQAARSKLQKAIDSGAGARVLERMIEAQGGDAKVVEDPDRLPSAPETIDVVADRAGRVEGIDALAVGKCGVAMGAGRTRADQAVDHAVGIELLVRRGDAVAKDEPLARLHVRDVGAADPWAVSVRQAITLVDGEEAPAPPVVLEALRG